jgi:hypothetical protein
MPVDVTQLTALVNDLEAKVTTLDDDGTANDQAQAAAQSAVANAAATLQTKNAAHDDVVAAAEALVAFVKAIETA